jgi:hypothetical protein
MADLVLFLARCRRVGDGGLLVEIQAEQLHQAVEGGIDSKAFTGDSDEDMDAAMAIQIWVLTAFSLVP